MPQRQTAILLLFDGLPEGPGFTRSDLFLSEPEVRTHRMLFDALDPIEDLRADLMLTQPEVRTHLLLLGEFGTVERDDVERGVSRGLQRGIGG